jgi:hypothetical protein
MRTSTFLRVQLGAVLAAGLLTAASAQAQSGNRVTPDGKRALVSKDIGGQRWAISRNPDRTVTGNVFFPDGGAPQFVFCTETGATADEVTLSCSGAEACPLAECQPNEWTFIADVTLPVGFFGATSAIARASSVPSKPRRPFAPAARLLFAKPSGSSPAGAPSGLQITPNAALALISKDVGDARWAITQNEDGTVTGNVFFPGGAEPRFVWCEPTAATPDPVALRCLGASACAAGAECSGADWTFIADVSLPASFFRARETVALDDVVAKLVSSFGEDTAFGAVALALDRGYSLRQVTRAALGGWLQPSGEIVPPAGGTEAPAGPSFGLLEMATPGLESSLGGGRQVTLQELLDRFAPSDADDLLLGVFFLLIERGYTFGQIVVELVLLDGTIPRDPPFVLRDESGAVVTPQNAPSTLFPPPGNCNDGTIDPPETCDRGDFGGATCETLNFGPGELECRNCQVDTSRCGPKCGNDRLERGEVCEGTNVGTATCEFLGFRAGGTLACNGNCEYDTSGCCETGKKPCGDICIPDDACCQAGITGHEDLLEEGLGLSPGTSSSSALCCGPRSKPCGDTCIPDEATCCPGGLGSCEPGDVCVDGGCCPSELPRRCGDTCIAAGASCCGDDIREAGEECDGPDLGGASCDGAGAVSCTKSCRLDRSGCQATCEPPSFECGSGCAPGGAQCCGPIGYCDPGEVCSGPGNDLCCPADKPDLCNGLCVAAGSVCCGTYACPAGDVCAGAGTCCPAAYAVFCGRQCFAPGSVCCGDGACIPGAVCTDGFCGPP